VIATIVFLFAAKYFTDEFILAKRPREGPIRAFALAVVVQSGGDNHCIHLGCQWFAAADTIFDCSMIPTRSRPPTNESRNVSPTTLCGPADSCSAVPSGKALGEFPIIEYTQPELEPVPELYACSVSFSISILFTGAKAVFRRPLRAGKRSR
jgi:hypothetical protein